MRRLLESCVIGNLFQRFPGENLIICFGEPQFDKPLTDRQRKVFFEVPFKSPDGNLENFCQAISPVPALLREMLPTLDKPGFRRRSEMMACRLAAKFHSRNLRLTTLAAMG